MKFGLSLRRSIATAALIVPARLVHGAGFDNLLRLIAQAKEEVTKLAADCDSTYAEIADLMEQFTRCEEGRARDQKSENSNFDGNMHRRYGTGGGDYGWTPKTGDSWNYNIHAPVEISVNADVIFIDIDGAQGTIDALHNSNRFVSCYISIGTVEGWRSDAAQFPASVIGNNVVGRSGEKWLDVTSPTVKDIITLRVEKAASMNCDAIDPGNMMVYTETDTGVEVSEEEQIAYNTWFAETVQAHGMKVGMKNAVELVPILSNHFDFAVHEQCHQHECDVYADTFLAEGKPVFNIEYVDDKGSCDTLIKNGMDTIIKTRNLGAPFCSCSDSWRNFKCDRVRVLGDDGW